MKTIRRIYFYLVAFISAIALTWGITNLLRSITSQQIMGDQSTILSKGLAQILVSIPIFLLHWLIVQRDARQSEEEKNSLVRGIYLYGILLASLIPVVQNLMALLNRLLLQGARLNPERAILGGYQTLSDNLIAIGVNFILAVYFYKILQSDWASSTDTSSLVDLKRLYRYIWMLYSLGLTILGVQKLVVFILTWQHSIGSSGKEQFSNALTLLIVGAPLWVYWWRLIQSVIHVEAERRSTLRTITLYILSLAGAITFSVNAGWIVYWLLRAVLGGGYTFLGLLAEMRVPISLALTFGVVWAYFSGILTGDISTETDTTKQAAMHRIYRYILAGLGLAGSIFGIAGVAGFIIDLLTKTDLIWQDYQQVLAQSLAVLLVGLMLWLVYWQKANHESVLTGAEGDHARRSLSRKIYLYLAIFACVIGTMASSGFLIYSLLQSLFGSLNYNLLNDVMQYARLIFLFAGFLAYHLYCLKRDNRALSRFLVEKQAAFPVVALLHPESAMGRGIQQAFRRFADGIPLQFSLPHEMQVDALKDIAALIIEGNLLEQADPDVQRLIHGYEGKVIVLPVVEGRYIWLNSRQREADIQKACALAARSLAEGQTIKPVSSNSPWLIISYIIAGLVGLQILAVLLSAVFSG
jgi:hypothetical protein